MDKKVNFRLTDDLYLFIEKYKLENNLEDTSDAIREIIKTQKKFTENGILFRLSKAISKN